MLETLSILHKSIANIVPIHGVAGNGDGTYRIDYIDDPTQEQLDQVNSIIGSWPLEKAKLEKLEEVDEEWKTILEAGWETSYGWSLGIDISDVALLNGNFVLAKEAASLGITDPVFVVDTTGQSHAFNLADLTSLMLQYGQARALLSSQDATKRTAIKNATTIEDLAEI
mgnify:FL=1|tara:strand:+ start:288 stop:794 length:507 start_codon:yes stop_codon:yes gene_type:complete